MPTTYTLIAYSCWIVLFAVWFIGQFGNKRTLERPRLGLYVITSVLIWFGFLLLFWQHHSSLLGIRLTPQNIALGVGGMMLTIASLLFAIWARVSLGRNWSGSTATVKQDHELITSGPYRFVRHPIYTGFLFGMLGTAFTIGTLTAYIGVVFFVIAVLIRIRIEESVMMVRFPQAYPDYKKISKTLIPWVF